MTSRALIKLPTANIWLPVSQTRASFKIHRTSGRAFDNLSRRPSSLAAGCSHGLATRWSSPKATRLRSSSLARGLGSTASATSISTDIAAAVSDVKENAMDLGEFVISGSRVTSVAHGVWRRVVRPGDTVIDATCGNGHDTLELARMVCADNASGNVYAFDIQKDALANSSYLLDQHLDAVQRKRIKLLQLCHSQLEKLIPENSVRLVTFNLGYLPGGDKSSITRVDTTIQSLQASSNVLQSGGMISVVAYIGHPGGREEFEAVMSFAANLPPDAWVCSQHEWVNRPLSPRLIIMLKK